MVERPDGRLFVSHGLELSNDLTQRVRYGCLAAKVLGNPMKGAHDLFSTQSVPLEASNLLRASSPDNLEGLQSASGTGSS